MLHHLPQPITEGLRHQPLLHLSFPESDEVILKAFILPALILNNTAAKRKQMHCWLCSVQRDVRVCIRFRKQLCSRERRTCSLFPCCCSVPLPLSVSGSLSCRLLGPSPLRESCGALVRPTAGTQTKPALLQQHVRS